jgi:hypothetical protein
MPLDQLEIPERSSTDTTEGLAGQDLLKVTAKVREVVDELNGLTDEGLSVVLKRVLASIKLTADQLPPLTDSDFPALAAGLKPTLDAYYAPLQETQPPIAP